MKPLVYFSYGMTKSASTLAYRLVWLALEEAGYPQPKLPASIVEEMHTVNFIGHLTQDQIDELWNIAEQRNYPVVVKTHSSPDPGMKELLKDGRAIGSAIYRDPRDIALSMLDHGAKARRKGQWAFKEYVELNDTLPSIRGQITCLEKWLRLPGMMPIRYQDVAQDRLNTTRRLLEQIGLTADAEAIVEKTRDNKYMQFNKGIHQRFRKEMAPEDITRMAKEFAPLIAMVDAPPTTTPALSADQSILTPEKV